MITLLKKFSSPLSVTAVILLVFVGLTALAGCESPGAASSATGASTSSGASDTAGSDKEQPADSKNPTEADNEKTQLTSDDQTAVEESIKAFGKAIEDGDYNTAEGYCMPDFKSYIADLAGGKGAVTDTFSMAIVEKLPIKLVSVKGCYDEGEKGLNYNITKDKPTVNFLVTFEIQQSNGEKKNAEGYTQGAKDADGKWRIEGFASGR